MKKMVLAAFAAAALTACTDEMEQPTDGWSARMQVDASISNRARSPMGGTSFNGSGYTIGVSLYDQKTGDAYDSKMQDMINIPYVSDFADGQTTWSSESPQVLSLAMGKAVAYYPYSASVTDIHAIPVDVTKSQTDYMYSGWSENINASHPQAVFNMKHALSAVNVFLKRGDYPFAGKVTSITVSSEGFGTSASMDAATGALQGLQGLQSPVRKDVDFVLDSEGKGHVLMFVPDTGVSGKPVRIQVTVDGHVYSADGTMDTEFKQGNIYKFPLLLNAGKLEVSSVSIHPWEAGDVFDGEMVEPDKTVI